MVIAGWGSFSRSCPSKTAWKSHRKVVEFPFPFNRINRKLFKWSSLAKCGNATCASSQVGLFTQLQMKIHVDILYKRFHVQFKCRRWQPHAFLNFNYLLTCAGPSSISVTHDYSCPSHLKPVNMLLRPL